MKDESFLDTAVGEVFTFHDTKYLKISETHFVPYFETIEDLYKYTEGHDLKDVH